MYDPTTCSDYDYAKLPQLCLSLLKGADIDRCVEPELKRLWAQGIETVCSCCGHGAPDRAYIVVEPEYQDQMMELGYEQLSSEMDRCDQCGVFFRAKLADNYRCPVYREYPEEEGARGTMFDVKPVTTGRATACGPACLKMLLAYYGIEAELDQLITECGVGIVGCTAADVLRVGRAHGLEALASYKMPPAEAATQDRPTIVWWRKTHFVVCCGLDDRGDVVICNPSRGRFSIDLDSFRALCTGLEPGSCVALCNGKPEDLPGPEPDDYGARITALEDELEAAKIILGVE